MARKPPSFGDPHGESSRIALYAAGVAVAMDLFPLTQLDAAFGLSDTRVPAPRDVCWLLNHVKPHENHKPKKLKP